MRQIPLPTSEQPISTQRTSLDGVSYRIDWRWNGRVSRWYWSLYDSDDAPVIQGRPLVAGWPLLHTCTAENAPPGELWLFTTDDEDPDLDGIESASLFYFTADEVEAL